VRIDPSRGPVLRSLLATLVVVTLIGACSSDDGGGAKSAKKAGTTTSTSTTVKGKDPCLLDRRDLSEVTGIEFDESQPQPEQDSCIYTSTEGMAAIALHLTSLGGNTPTQALDEATTTCDEGSVQRLDFAGADGGFSCLVKGVATVGAAGEGVFAVLTGATVQSNVPTERILRDLATILEHAISGT
jgi:hypothetical protein